MKIKKAWAIQSFCLCFLFNLALGALIFYMADRGLEALNQWISPLIGAGAPASPDDLHMALGGFGSFVADARRWLMPLLAALILAVTFLQWFFLFLAGSRQIRRAGERASLSPGDGERSGEPEAVPT
jgi:hypothetical protein